MTSVSTVLGPIYVDDQGADGPVALLWPSLFSDHRMWAHQVDALRKSGWRTLAIDPPGHGRSPGPGRDFTLDECAQAAVEILDAKGVRTPVVLFGTSWGGFVAPRIALRIPDRVRGMVLFNTSADGSDVAERIRGTLLTLLLRIGPFRAEIDRMLISPQLSAETRRRDPDLVARLAADLGAWDRRAIGAAVRSILVHRDSVLEALPGVTAPTLVVSGKDDKIIPSIHSRRIVEQLVDARYVEVAGAAHLVPLEQPEAASALVLQFIAALPRLDASGVIS